MITKLNLASRPFRNRTTPYLLSLILLAVAVSGGLLSFSQMNKAVEQNEIAKNNIRHMSEELSQLEQRGRAVQQKLTPDQQNLLIASHRLVASKTFGWSRLFADLEAVLPGSVSASRVVVENIYKDGDRIKAELEFGVLSRNYQAVITMIANMNNSGLFRAELRGQDRQQKEHLVFTEYTLRLVYTPAYGYSVAQAADVAQSGNGGGQ